MQRILIGMLVLIAVIFVAATAASAAPLPAEPVTGPYEGVFYGYIHSDNGSKAPMILELSHRVNQVKGNIYLGEGLYVDAGMCGAGNVPAGQQFASGQTLSGDPSQLQASTNFQVQGFDIGVDLVSRVAPDGNSLDAEAKIDLPWLCGGDPTISGTLVRYQPQ
jgi:hypothetical protein